MKNYNPENNKIINRNTCSGLLGKILYLKKGQTLHFAYKNNKGQVIFKTINCLGEKKAKNV